jgi:hypothetical protein
MTWPRSQVANVASRINFSPGRVALSLGTGGAGAVFVHMALMSVSVLLIVVVGLAITAVAHAGAAAVESIWKRRPQVVEKKGAAKEKKIRAKGEARVGKIKAKAEAKSLLERTRQLGAMESRVSPTDILDAIALRAANPDLPEDRRPTDDTLIKILEARDGRNGAAGPTGPTPPGSPGLYSVTEDPPGA